MMELPTLLRTLGSRFSILIFLAAVFACASQSVEAENETRAQAKAGAGRGIASDPWAAAPFELSISARDGRTGERLSWPELVNQLAAAEAVFLGESHTDESTHRVELAVYEAMLEQRNNRVVLAMEMFQRDAQGILDAYLAGEIEETEFLEKANPWGNYQTAYRPMIEAAKAAGRPVIASNFPNSMRRRIAREGSGILAELEGAEAQLAPTEFHANSQAYWERVDNAVRGHIGMMGNTEAGDPRLYSTQSLWDNSMGEACADSLEQNPDDQVVHVNGGFHSQYWDGTVRQLLLRRPESKVKTVAIVPVSNPSMATLDGAPLADYIVFAHALATDINEGTHSVYVQRELKYRLHMPESIRPGEKVPLLIWLVDRGLNAQDGIDLWRSRLGDSVAIAAIEPPYSAIQADQSVAGRWYWPESFAEDTGFLHGGIHQTWGYLLRHFPIDPARVCLAGEGTGATVVSVVTLMTDDMAIDGRAFAPRRFSKIKDMPLPLPQYRSEGWGEQKSLQVYAFSEDQDWWSEELGAYQQIGLENELHAPSGDPWMYPIYQENELRRAMALPALVIPDDAPRQHIVLDEASQRGQHWARLLAADIALEQKSLVAVLPGDVSVGHSTKIETRVLVTDMKAPKALPVCPGPFGGTTVLVLPSDTQKEQIDAWLELEADDPLTKRSRFLRLRIAHGDGERSLHSVLAKLESENRKNILIVPAVFCASADTMRGLSEQVMLLKDRMTLHWQAGLGGQISGR